MYKVHCVKCHVEYEDSDPEDFYCPPCNEERKRIAKEVDAKLVGKVSKEVKSGIQLYDEYQKRTGNKFISSKVLGL